MAAAQGGADARPMFLGRRDRAEPLARSTRRRRLPEEGVMRRSATLVMAIATVVAGSAVVAVPVAAARYGTDPAGPDSNSVGKEWTPGSSGNV